MLIPQRANELLTSRSSQLWPAALARGFAATDLREVKEERTPRKPWTLPVLQDLTLMLAGEFTVAEAGEGGEAGERQRQHRATTAAQKRLVDAAAAEQQAAARGVAIATDIITVIGRKAQ